MISNIRLFKRSTFQIKPQRPSYAGSMNGSLYECYHTQHNDTQHNATQHNATQHNDTQHNDSQHNETQHNETQQNDTLQNDTHHNDSQHNNTQHNDTQYNCKNTTLNIILSVVCIKCHVCAEYQI